MYHLQDAFARYEVSDANRAGLWEAAANAIHKVRRAYEVGLGVARATDPAPGGALPTHTGVPDASDGP